MKLIFQIGFNKCATTSLDRLFRRSGYSPFSTSGQVWVRRGRMQKMSITPQILISNNIKAGIAPLTGLEQFDGFFDMEYVRPNLAVENYFEFRTFAKFYPDAYFLLNTRDVDDWINSRLNHRDGRYLELAKMRHNLDTDQIIALWRKLWDEHHADVREFFADGKHKFMEFHISKTPISELVDFVSADFSLDQEQWQRERQTKNPAISAKL